MQTIARLQLKAKSASLTGRNIFSMPEVSEVLLVRFYKASTKDVQSMAF